VSDLAVVAPRLGQLIRLLASDKDGEVLATVYALRRVLSNAGLDLHDLADNITTVALAKREAEPRPDGPRPHCLSRCRGQAALQPPERSRLPQG
jgi:hypothetical protein